MATLQKVQIFPAIRTARIGNSQDWFLGPELPFPAPISPPPGGDYKDAICRIKRQAQRFRLGGRRVARRQADHTSAIDGLEGLGPILIWAVMGPSETSIATIPHENPGIRSSSAISGR